VLSWAAIRIGCPKLQVFLSEVHNKATEINGFTVSQLFLNMFSCTSRPVMAEKTSQLSSGQEGARVVAGP